MTAPECVTAPVTGTEMKIGFNMLINTRIRHHCSSCSEGCGNGDGDGSGYGYGNGDGLMIL